MRGWPFALVLILLVALGAFATLQVRWIDQALAAEERRTRDEMEQSARRVSEEAMRELFTAVNAFDESNDVDAAYSNWKKTARDPRLIREVIAQPASIAVERLVLNYDPLQFVLPNLVIQIDEKVFFAYVADLARRSFGSGFDVAISRGDTIVYRSDPQITAANADLTRGLLMLMRRERRAPAPPAPLMLLVRHHGQPLAAVFAARRRRDLSVAGGVLLVLAASLVLLAWAARRADQLRRRQLEFIAGVTHELHTPLAALAAAGQNLADGVSVDVATYGNAIVKEARRLTDLVDEVLAFSGMEAGRATPMTDVDVRDVIRDAIADARVETSSDGAAVVRGDRDALTRAVHNLVTNAIRHGRVGGWVGVRSFAENGHVVIRVDDDGPGITPEDLPHLFEPFYRGRNAQVKGSGLGLAIVDRVARAHGGSVAAANRREGGASFTLRLPVHS